MPRTTTTTANGQLTKLTFWPEQLVQARTDRGVTQATLARQAGITRSSLCDIEHGRRSPSYDLAAHLAAALDVHIGAFCRAAPVDRENENIA